MENLNIFKNAVITVLKGRVKEIGTGQKQEHYAVGNISVILQTSDKITRIRCSCKHHGVKDIHALGLCSASLAVLFYKMGKTEREEKD